MTREAAILLTLLVYLLALVGIGLWARRRTRDAGDYFLAGRTMGPWVASLSASASSSSAWTLLGVSGFAYDQGLSAIWLFPACVGGFALNWYVLAPALRDESHRGGALTLTEILASTGSTRQRRTLRIVASAIVLSALVTYVASQFQGAGQTLAETFGLSPSTAVVIGGAIVVCYTMLGGFWAVSLTDTLQGFMMAITATILPIAAVSHIGVGNFLGGIAQVTPGYADPFQGMPLAAAAGFVLGLLGIGLGYPGQPHVVNRFMALRQGEQILRTGRRVAMAWAVSVYAGMLILGWAARVGFVGIDSGEQAMLQVTHQLFHPVVAGAMIAAILSAVMSTADSQLLVAASTVSHDLGLGENSSASLLVRSRWVVLLLSCLAVFAALAVDQTIFDRVLFAWSAMGCAFGPLLLVRVLSGPIDARFSLAAMVAGFSLSVGAYLLKPLGWFGVWSGASERIVPFAIALLLAWIGRKTYEEISR